MAASCIVPYTFAAVFVQPEVINFFQTMNGWQKADELDLPNGLVAFENNPNLSKFITNANDDRSGGSNAMTFTSTDTNQLPYIPFSETITTGVIHMSFDMYFPDEAMPALLITAFGNTVNNNINDLRNMGGNDYDIKCIAAWNANNGGYFGSATGTNGNFSFNNDVSMDLLTGWHKYDLLFDMESREISYYMDGTELCDPLKYSNDFTGFKGIVFRFQKAGDNPLAGIYVDNIYTHHYNKLDTNKWDDIRLGVDSNGEKIVALAFSEAVALGDLVLPTDFTVKNVATDETVVPSDAVTIDTGIKLTFDTIPSGEYEVSISDSAKEAYKGSISGKTVDGTAMFTISGEAIAQESTRRYYINEDFESYKGGLPAGWVPVNVDLSTNIAQDTQSQADGVLSGGGSGGTALELSSTNKYTYEFDQAIKSGKFTVEFDVKTENGGWAVSLLNEADMIGADRVPKYHSAYTAVTDKAPTVLPQSTRYNAMRDAAQAAAEEAGQPFDEAEWRSENWKTLWDAHIINRTDPTAAADRARMTFEDRMNTVLVGNTVTGEKTVKYNSNKQSWFSNTYSGAELDFGKWHHIKLDIDIEGRTMRTTLDGQEQASVTPNSGRFGIEEVYNTENGWTEYLGGVKAIGISCYDAGKAYYDNIQVYTDNSLNVNVNFDQMVPSGRHPGIYKADTPQQNLDNQGSYKVVTDNRSVDGRDKALHISSPMDNYTFNGQVMIPFNIPLNGLQPLTVEFDVKTGDEPWDAFTMDLVTGDDLYKIPNYNSGMPTNTPEAHYNAHCVFTTANSSEFTKKDQYPFRFARNSNWDFVNVQNSDEGAGNQECYLQPDTWYHIKFHMTPAADHAVYQAEINQENSDDIFVTEPITVWGNVIQYYKKGISGVMFQLLLADKSYITDGMTMKASKEEPAEFWIDNVKAYEQEVVPVELLSATVNNIDGTTYALSDTVTSEAESITLKFSAPITSVDGISMYYPRNNTVVPAEYTLSDDRTSVNITFTESPTADENITLAVSNQLQSECSYAGGVKAESFSFQYKNIEDGDIHITEFRLYEYVESRGAETDWETEGAWVPVTWPDLRSYTELPKLKFVVSGFNSAAEKKNLNVIVAGYDEANNQTTSVAVHELEVSQGNFTVSVEDIQFDPVQDMLKAFVWEKDTLRPLAECLDYALNKGGTETQN